MTNYAQKATKGVIIIFINYMVAQLISYLVRLLYARKLTTTEFGLFYAVFGLLSLITVFKEFGLNEALTKFISEFLVNKRHADIKNSFVYASVIQFFVTGFFVFLLFIFSNFLAEHYFHHPLASLILKILAFSFWFDSFNVILKNSFLGFQKNGLFSGMTAVRMLFILVASFLLFKVGYGIFAAVFSYFFVPFFLIMLFYPILFKKVFPAFTRISLSFDRTLLKNLFRFGIPMMFYFIGAVILGYTDTAFLTYFSLDWVAVYNVAMPTASVLIFLIVPISSTLFPLASELWTRGKKDTLIMGIEILYKYLFIFIVPVFLILFMFPSTLIGFLFGRKFLEFGITLFNYDFLVAPLAMQILLIGMLAFVLEAINGSTLQGIGKPKISMWITYAAAVLNIILNVILIPVYGVVGAAVSTAICYIISLILGTFFLRKHLNFQVPFKQLFRNIVAGGFLAGLVFFLKKVIILSPLLELAVIAVIASLAYVALLFVFRLVRLKDIKEIKAILTFKSKE